MKIDELREKSVSELNELIVDCKKQLFEIRFKKNTNQYDNATDFGKQTLKLKT